MLIKYKKEFEVIMILITMLTALAGAPGPAAVTKAKETIIVENEPEEIALI